jgi:hypothetical protein
MIPPDRTNTGASDTPASIAAMPKILRPIALALFLAAAAGGVLGCGGSSGPDPSLNQTEAGTLAGQIQEIQDNVDVDSPCVAADRTDNLIADIDALPSTVNDQVKQALQSGANNLKLLLAADCEGRTTTTETTTTESTTEPTTTERTQPTTTTKTQSQPTTTTPTQTLPSTTTGGSGGIGPGGL